MPTGRTWVTQPLTLLHFYRSWNQRSWLCETIKVIYTKDQGLKLEVAQMCKHDKPLKEIVTSWEGFASLSRMHLFFTSRAERPNCLTKLKLTMPPGVLQQLCSARRWTNTARRRSSSGFRDPATGPTWGVTGTCWKTHSAHQKKKLKNTGFLLNNTLPPPEPQKKMGRFQCFCIHEVLLSKACSKFQSCKAKDQQLC